METFLYIVFFVSCVLLVIAVLLQPGKTDAGALFTSNISSASLNPRGTQSVLSKLTIAMAAIFMLSALLLSLPAITGEVSVLETQGESSAPANSQSGNSNSSQSNADSSGDKGSAAPDSDSSEKTGESDEKGSSDAKSDDGDSKSDSGDKKDE